jgi:hypothetical protein
MATSRTSSGEEFLMKFEPRCRAALVCLLLTPHLQPQSDDLHDIDRKQHGVKKKYGIKLSCDAVEDE